MSYTLEELILDCKSALHEDSGPAGREMVRSFVSRACLDEEFIVKHLSDPRAPERQVLYEDPEVGFCICAHHYKEAKGSKPHGHGGSWAIYGQAVGQTFMNEWKCLQEPTSDEPGIVEKVAEYMMLPGDAVVYNEEDLHSPRREDTTRLIRIEGKNLENVVRKPYAVGTIE